MIVLMLKDGLGNQMFEYAYAKKLQEQSGDQQIAICTFLYNLKNFSLGGTRNCSLHHFKLDNQTVVLHGIPNLMAFAGFMLRLFRVYREDFISWFVKGKRVSRGEKYSSDCEKGVYVSEGSFMVPPYVKSRSRIKYIFGNYEGIHALPEKMGAFRTCMEITTEPSSENSNMLEQINRSEAVCVHIRRGDYLNAGNEWLQVCTKEYYLRGIRYMQDHVASPTFFIFSNTHKDLEWIKNNYEFDFEPVYVDLSNPDYEELRLMSKCKHFVISNSTFSWWAAQISGNPKKIVYVPQVWSKRDKDSSKMYDTSFKKDRNI